MAYKYNIGELVDALSKYPRDAPLTTNTSFRTTAMMNGMMVTLTLEFLVPDEHEEPSGILKELT